MLTQQDGKNIHSTELTDRAFIRLQGADSEIFLQNLLTQNVEPQSDALIAAALLTPQGKLLDDFLVWQNDDGIYLDCDAERIDDIFRKLSMYKLRSDVTLKRQDGHPWVVWSPEADLSDQLATLRAAGKWVHRDPRDERLGLRCLQPPKMINNWKVASTKQWNNFRLSLVIPQGAIEMPPGEVFPLEFGLQNANMISFQKGCYIGQEVTSRSHRRGTLKKGLFLTPQGDPAFNVNDEITVEEKTAGKIVIAGDDIAIALIRFDADMTKLSISGRSIHVAKPNILK